MRKFEKIGYGSVKKNPKHTPNSKHPMFTGEDGNPTTDTTRKRIDGFRKLSELIEKEMKEWKRLWKLRKSKF